MLNEPEAEVAETPEAEDVQVVTPKKAAEQLRGLLATLVPPTTVEVVDAYGGKHSLRGILPARAQIMVMQKIEVMLEIDVDGAALGSAFGDGDGGGMAAMTGALIKMASKPVVLDAISGAFGVAHPKAVKAATQAARSEGEKGPLDAADLFPIEEMVEGLLPFFLRLAGKMVNLLSKMTEADSEPRPAPQTT